jgi:hypothetical protein
MQMRKLRGERRCLMALRLIPMMGYEVCVELGCIFLQESSGFLCFPFLWHFFHRNHDSCSAVTFFLPPQKSGLYRAYVRSRRKLRRT